MGQKIWHTIQQNLWKFGLNWSSKLQETNKRNKTPLVTDICGLPDAWERPALGLKSLSDSLQVDFKDFALQHTEIDLHTFNANRRILFYISFVVLVLSKLCNVIPLFTICINEPNYCLHCMVVFYFYERIKTSK